jgi:hypothetical protein
MRAEIILDWFRRHLLSNDVCDGNGGHPGGGAGVRLADDLNSPK